MKEMRNKFEPDIPVSLKEKNRNTAISIYYILNFFFKKQLVVDYFLLKIKL